MLLLVLALFWVALLAPVAIRRFRDGGGEKSIESFHAEHEVLSRQDYTVVPAHRLDEPDEEVDYAPPAERRPHLRVVHSDDTPRTLAARSTWDEWAEDYTFDEPVAAAPTNHYARAYSSRPSEPEITQRYEPPIRRRTMKQQRRVMFTSLVGASTFLTVIAFLTGVSILVDLSALAWFSVVLFVALALFAVSQGYLNEPSLRVRLPQRRTLARVEPMYDDEEGEQSPYVYYDDEFDSEFYDPESPETWRREPERRRALG
ncbi:MAG: hypothetical protein WCF63_03575 [Acidimicrobiales bacterium]|jgi:hypothetical protein